LNAVGPTLRVGEWTRVEDVLSRSEVSVLRTGRAKLADIEPFHLAVEGLGSAVLERTSMVIAVAAVGVGDGDEFFVLASRPDASKSRATAGVGEIVDPACPQRARVQ